MKTILVLSLLTVLGAQAFAATPEDRAPKVYTLTYRLKSETLEVRRPADSYEEAYKKSAPICFEHFRRLNGGQLTEDQGLDVIDACANPRS